MGARGARYGVDARRAAAMSSSIDEHLFASRFRSSLGNSPRREPRLKSLSLNQHATPAPRLSIHGTWFAGRLRSGTRPTSLWADMLPDGANGNRREYAGMNGTGPAVVVPPHRGGWESGQGGCGREEVPSCLLWSAAGPRSISKGGSEGLGCPFDLAAAVGGRHVPSGSTAFMGLSGGAL